MTKVLEVLFEKTSETDCHKRVAKLLRDEHFESVADLVEAMPNVTISMRADFLDKIHSKIQSIVGHMLISEQKRRKAERSIKRILWLEEHNLPVLSIYAMMLTKTQRLQLDKALQSGSAIMIDSQWRTRFVSMIRRIRAAVETEGH
jgi:hypothetical protein